MTIFASTPPINDDPEPYVRTYSGLDPKRISAEYAAQTKARYENSFGQVVVTQHHPRPKFNRPRAHEVNRVLLHFRSQSSPVIPRRSHVIGFLNGIYRLGSEGFAPSEIQHAHRVLLRWMRVFG